MRIVAAGRMCCQVRAVNSLTAANAESVGASRSAASTSGSGGVCSVVIIGAAMDGAMATGRWCRLLLWTTSNAPAPSPASQRISSR